MSSVVWMVPSDSEIAHAFYRADLESGVPRIAAVKLCGPWPAEALREAEFAERCRPCQRLVTELERADNEPP